MDKLELKAYGIFYLELPKHLFLAKDVLLKNFAVNLDIKEQLRAAFHNIKGGAGFFKQEELAACAYELELLVKESDLTVQAEARQQYQDKLIELEKLILNLPRPRIIDLDDQD